MTPHGLQDAPYFAIAVIPLITGFVSYRRNPTSRLGLAVGTALSAVTVLALSLVKFTTLAASKAACPSMSLPSNLDDPIAATSHGYFDNASTVVATIYAVAAVAIIAIWVWKHRRSGRRWLPTIGLLLLALLYVLVMQVAIGQTVMCLG